MFSESSSSTRNTVSSKISVPASSGLGALDDSYFQVIFHIYTTTLRCKCCIDSSFFCQKKELDQILSLKEFHTNMLKTKVTAAVTEKKVSTVTKIKDMAKK